MVAVRVDESAHAGGRVVRYALARTHLGRPLYWVSAYWVDGVLVDAGPRWSRDALRARLAGRRVDAIWITHHHEDHVGNAGPLCRERGVEALASEDAVRLAAAEPPLPWYRRHVWGDPDAGRPTPLPRRVSTRRHAFDVVPVPGHSPGDVAFVEAAEGWAFTGDLYLSARQSTTRPGEDLEATLGSLRRLAALEPTVLFTGMRVVEGATAALRRRIDFLEDTLAALSDARDRGWSPARARRRLLGREGFLHYISRGDFAKRHFVDQAYACLDHRVPRPPGPAPPASGGPPRPRRHKPYI